MAVTSYLLEAGSAPGLSNLARVPTGSAADLVFDERRAVRHVLRAGEDDQWDRDDRTVERSGGHRGPGVVHGRARGAEWPCVIGRRIDRLCCTGARAAGRRSRTCSKPDRRPAWRTSRGSISASRRPRSRQRTCASGTYYVRVRATNACGTSSPSNEILMVVPSATPAGHRPI